MKTSELIGDDLDLWVAKIDQAGHDYVTVNADFVRDYAYHPSTNWKLGGPIIERADIWMSSDDTLAEGHPFIASCHPHSNGAIQAGPTKLIAAMRAFVASKFGEEVPGCPSPPAMQAQKE